MLEMKHKEIQIHKFIPLRAKEKESKTVSKRRKGESKGHGETLKTLT